MNDFSAAPQDTAASSSALTIAASVVPNGTAAAGATLTAVIETYENDLTATGAVSAEDSASPIVPTASLRVVTATAVPSVAVQPYEILAVGQAADANSAVNGLDEASTLDAPAPLAAAAMGNDPERVAPQTPPTAVWVF
ncbi:MAG: hypothetical protein HC828_22670 [Blastochloris sp.]|nr:hypothetical protein [Blastochloris sp.]